MPTYNYKSRELIAKIVYYGPGRCGKTTNLQQVHAKMRPETRSDLLSVATETDRTIYFDLLPLNLGTINGMKFMVRLFTVPGQVYYSETRKLVLRGTDGVVFVADSQDHMLDENRESLRDLKTNLEANGIDYGNIPLVLQYNKRDLPRLVSEAELDATLNDRGVKALGAIASQGVGVLETLRFITVGVFNAIKAGGMQAGLTPPTTSPPKGRSLPPVTDGLQGAAAGLGHAPDLTPPPSRADGSYDLPRSPAPGPLPRAEGPFGAPTPPPSVMSPLPPLPPLPGRPEAGYPLPKPELAASGSRPDGSFAMPRPETLTGSHRAEMTPAPGTISSSRLPATRAAALEAALATAKNAARAAVGGGGTAATPSGVSPSPAWTSPRNGPPPPPPPPPPPATIGADLLLEEFKSLAIMHSQLSERLTTVEQEVKRLGRENQDIRERLTRHGS